MKGKRKKKPTYWFETFHLSFHRCCNSFYFTSLLYLILVDSYSFLLSPELNVNGGKLRPFYTSNSKPFLLNKVLAFSLHDFQNC